MPDINDSVGTGHGFTPSRMIFNDHPGFLTDQQRSSLRFLKNPTRIEQLALRLDELFRLVGRHVARWNDRPAEDRRHMRLAYGCSAKIQNWGMVGWSLGIVGTPNVAVRIDDDFTDRQFEFRFDPSILGAPDPDEAIGLTIGQITSEIDGVRQHAWKPEKVGEWDVAAEVDAKIAETN